MCVSVYMCLCVVHTCVYDVSVRCAYSCLCVCMRALCILLCVCMCISLCVLVYTCVVVYTYVVYIIVYVCLCCSIQRSVVSIGMYNSVMGRDVYVCILWFGYCYVCMCACVVCI